MTVMVPVAIVGHVPETAGIIGPSPEVMTVPPLLLPLLLLEPASFLTVDPELDPEPELDPDPDPELKPPPEPLPPLDPELALPELLEALPSDSVPPFEDPTLDPPAPVPSEGVPGLLAHPAAVVAPSHASAVHRAFAIELTLHAFAAIQRMFRGC
jgi:hypothetical protein